jgi:hypothetical protein
MKTAIGKKTGAIYGISLDEETEKKRKMKPAHMSKNSFSVEYSATILIPLSLTAFKRKAHQGSVPAIIIGAKK